MLTNLDFLKVGQQFPPKCEIERLQKYEKNRLIFEGKHEEVYSESFKRIKRVINNFEDVISYSVVANYQKLISLKIADFMLGEPPKILCGNDNSNHQNVVEEIKNNSDLINTLYTSCLDLSRFGDSVLLVYKDENSKPVIDLTSPNFYFKIVDEKNIRKVTNHVLAHTFEKTVTSGLFAKEKKEKYLYVQIHSKGFYEEFTCRLNDNNVIVASTETNRIKTGLNDFAIVPVHNLLTSDRSYGIDDYADLDSIISEIEVRLSQISKILDKHAEPSMQGPETALTQNEYGQWELKVGNYFPKSPEDGEVSYITWEAQLTANFEIIEKLINILSTVSEMGSAIFDNNQKQGQIASGTALRRMMISPLAKVNRIRMRFDSAIKKSLVLASQLTSTSLENECIHIIWNDGLPTDEKEEAEIMAIRSGNKATISQWSAIQRLDNLTDEDVAKELEAIKQDEKDNNPLSNMNFDYGKE
ncbi:MAG: phage portal protein [Paraclostridium sp.]